MPKTPTFRTVLYGPDNQYGAQRKPTFARYLWYIVWREDGKKREHPTGIERVDGGEAECRSLEEALETFLADRRRSAIVERTDGPRTVDQLLISEALTLYSEDHGGDTEAPARIGYAIDALLTYWKDLPVSAITKATCKAYVTHRAAAYAEKERQRIVGTLARIKAERAYVKAPKPARIFAPSTARRELGVLQAALTHCIASGYLVTAPPVTLAPKGRARERWLTRSEVAKLVRGARKVTRGTGGRLPYLILLFVYHGPRRAAAVTLQWAPNLVGGHINLDRGMIDFRKPGAETKKERVLVPIARRLKRFLFGLRRRTTQYVFERTSSPDEKGQRRPIPVLDPTAGIAKAAQFAGLGKVTAHTLRHTAITWLVQDGVPIWQVAHWVGASPEMIERVYGHHSPDRFKDVQRVHK